MRLFKTLVMACAVATNLAFSVTIEEATTQELAQLDSETSPIDTFDLD